MSNVFSNASFAVLSVMQTKIDNDFLGSVVYVQKKPEADFGKPTTVAYLPADFPEVDFNVQERFEANIVPNIHQQISQAVSTTSGFSEANSNISVKSYGVSFTEIT
mgnify:FL=1